MTMQYNIKCITWNNFVNTKIARDCSMTVFTVSFFGHRRLTDPLAVEKKLQAVIQEQLLSKEYVEFLVGRDGEFDQLVSSTVRRCKREIRDDNSSLVLVLPYETAEYRNVEVCATSAEKHFKAAHQIRNRAMVDRSHLVVFYIEHESGGAYQTFRYAKKSDDVPLLFLTDK